MDNQANALTNDVRRSVGRIALLLFVDLMIVCITSGEPGWIITQLTDNEIDDKAPAISGTNVVWMTEDYPYGQWAINSNFAGQIGIGMEPDISGTNVVWRRYTGTLGTHIYSNFAGVLSGQGCVHPRISGTNVVWQAGNKLDSNFGWQHAGGGVRSPAISGTNVVWAEWDNAGNLQIYSNFAGQLSDASNGRLTNQPDISGENVVWEQYDSGSYIYIYSNFAGKLSGSGQFSNDQSPAVRVRYSRLSRPDS